MKPASVTELKANLSRYLRMAKRGNEVQILERGVPIARLVGIGTAAPGPDAALDRARLDRLTRAGILRRGAGGLAWAHAEAPVKAVGADLAGALDDDRGDRT